MMRRFLLFFLLLSCGSDALAQDGQFESAFYEGNRLFNLNQYKEAAEAYEQALAGDRESAALHFNLGNAYLFDGRHGPALYHYRLAERLAPRDEDVQKNLATARGRASDKLGKEPPPKFLQTLLWLHQKTTPGESMLLFALLWLTGFALLHLRQFSRSRWPIRLAVPLLVFGLALGVSLTVRAFDIGVTVEAVVLPAEVQVFNGPAESFLVHFELHQGAEVEILEDRGDWMMIAAGQELKGFVPKQQLGLIR